MSNIEKQKVTIMIDRAVYHSLRHKVGQRGIGDFLSALARPLVLDDEIEKGYREQAQDKQAQKESKDWLDFPEEISEENSWNF